MKQFSKMLCIILIYLFLLISLLLIDFSIAYAAGDNVIAASRITIYNQGDDDSKYGRTDGTLRKSACGLFTINHAMQWVGIKNVPSPQSMAYTDSQRNYGNQAGYYSFDGSYWLTIDALEVCK